MSNVKVFVLMAGLTSLFVAIGGAIGGQSGMIMAFVLAAATHFIMYYASSTIVLRMYGAKVVTEREAPELYGVVDKLRQRASLPTPTVAIAPAYAGERVCHRAQPRARGGMRNRRDPRPSLAG